MKLKIILIVLVAFFACAFAVSPRVLAEGEITTTQGETLTTEPVTTVDPIQAEIDAQLEKAKAAIISYTGGGLGAGTVGAVVAGFLKRRRKQVDTAIGDAKKKYEDASTAANKIVNDTSAKFDAFEKKTEAFQDKLYAKYEDAIAKANEQTAKATAIIATYQQREEALAAFVKAEADEAAAAIEAQKLAAIASATAVVQKVSAECGKE